MAKLVSKVYGDALFSEAMEKGLIEDWYEEAALLTGVFQDNADLLQFLNHPQIPKEEKLQAVEHIFSGKLSDGLVGFLRITIEKGRQNDILSILNYFIQAVKEYKKIGVVTVTSAMELSDAQKAELEKKLLETTPYVSLELTYLVDETLLGGMVIRIGDRVVDSSIRTRLSQIKKDLIKLQLA